MIDRRSFLNRLSSTALLAAVPDAAKASVEAPAQISRTRVPLNGEWERRIGGKYYDTITVPCSCRPSGSYGLNRRFALPRPNRGERIFVHFEGITYWGRVSVNGQILGDMGPYTPHEFEFTKLALEGDNEIEVVIADLVPFGDGTAKSQTSFGIHAGFEAYGGIVRDIWAEVRPASFVENVRLAYELKNDYTSCAARPRIAVSSAESAFARVEAVLYRHNSEVARCNTTAQLAPGANDIELAFEFEEVEPWAPETPNLYELAAGLTTTSSKDSWACRTGFREIVTEGREFRLNGNRLVLNGVCRHDMWKDQGFTLSRRQQEQDMRMIKALGCNFVRLVHYPHDRRIVELADELGLLVSEEPGFWQANFQTAERETIELGYKVLEATIRRDWNSPSVAIWFLANECTLTEEFLREGKRRCNQLDPIGRLVSAANDKDSRTVRPLFIAAKMDFFDQHEYTFALDEMNQEAKFDGPSKPLTFSEWGGKSVGQAEPIMGQTVDRLLDLVASGELSGHMFWSWQDLRQYSRIDGEVRDGVLESGVVTEAREQRAGVRAELSRLFEAQRHRSPEDDIERSRLTVLPLRNVCFGPRAAFTALDLQPVAESAAARQSWAALEASLEKHWASIADDPANDQWKRTGSQFLLWQRPELKIHGVPFRSAVLKGGVRPIVLTSESSEVAIPIHQKCRQLHILGQVTFPLGYPLIGKAEEQIAIYTLQYASGRTHPVPIRNGIEVAQANFIDRATRILPMASAAQPAVEYIKDTAREHYQVLLFSIGTQPEELVSLRCRLHPSQPALAIFAITCEGAPG